MMLRSVTIVFLLFVLIGCAHKDPYAFYKGRQNFLNQNYGIARQQLLEPAEEGNPEAQYAMGYMYLNGLGTPTDEHEGRKWIKEAAQSGYPPAEDALRILGPEIEAEDQYGEYRIKGISHPPARQGKKRRKPIHTQRTRQIKTVAMKIPVNEHLVTQAARTDPSLSASPSTAHEDNYSEILMSIPASSYTIQIMGAYDLDSIQRFVKMHQLQQQTRHYPTKRDGKTWHNLLYGTYPNSNQATRKLNDLPEHLKILKPWVKPMKQVHREILTGKPPQS